LQEELQKEILTKRSLQEASKFELYFCLL
jgi:hypothetical protein